MRAADLIESGWSNRDVAAALGCDVSGVCGWRRKLAEGGRQAPRSRSHPGKPSKLSGRQRADLLRRLEAGPRSQGFPGQLFPGAVVDLPADRRPDRTPVRRRVPRRQPPPAADRPGLLLPEAAEAARRAGRGEGPGVGREGLAAGEKKARRLAAALVFVDETGFPTRPYAGRTWAPIGRTPTIVYRMRHRESVTVLGALTLSPARRRLGLYAEFLRGRGVRQEDLVGFLGRLRRQLRRPPVVVLDNLGAHKGRRLRDWATGTRAGRLPVHLEYLPPYAPELNPIEPAWSHGKTVTAAGRCVDDADGLESLAREAVATAAARQRTLRGFIRSTGLPLRFDLPPDRI